LNELPDSAYPPCLICSKPVRPGTRVLHEVLGFTRHRHGGGANHIIGRRETGRVVCDDCAPSVQRGFVEQLSLLGQPTDRREDP
jgi:hypothetical protein